MILDEFYNQQKENFENGVDILDLANIIKIDVIIGIPGINQVRFNNIVLNQASFYIQPYILLLILEGQKQSPKRAKSE